VLGKFTREDEADGSLDLTRRDGGALVVSSQLGSFTGDALEDVVHKGIEDRHGFVGDSGVRVDLLQDSVDVGAVSLLADLALTTAFGRLLALGSSLGRCLSSGGGHRLLLSSWGSGLGRHYFFFLKAETFKIGV